MNTLFVILTLSIRNVPYVCLHQPSFFTVRTNPFAMSESEDAFADESMHVNDVRQLTFDEIEEAAWVLIFDGGTPEEGVYTIEDIITQKTSIIAFLRFKDAYTFAKVLTKEGYTMPTPMQWTADDLARFCKTGGYHIIVVPYGHALTPPAAKHTSNNEDIRKRLEDIYPLLPENCTDDDCIV